jgi:hypothetical protein
MSPTIDLGLQSQPELWLRVPHFVVVVATYVFEFSSSFESGKDKNKTRRSRNS